MSRNTRSNAKANNDTQKAEKADDQKRDYPTELVAATNAWIIDNSTVGTLQSVFVSIPSAARFSALTMAQKVVQERRDWDLMDAYNDAINAAKPTQKVANVAVLSDDEKATIRVAAVLNVAAMVAFSGGIATTKAAIEKAVIAAKAIDDTAYVATEKAIADAIVGVIVGAQKRARFTETMSDLIADGRLTVGQKLHGPNGAWCTIQADGRVKLSNKGAATSTSKAGEKASGNSTNGWDFWRTADDVQIGPMRRF